MANLTNHFFQANLGFCYRFSKFKRYSSIRLTKRREAFKRILRKLHDAFGVTLDRIKRQGEVKYEQAMKVLQWVFLAEKQLMMEGLCHALSVDPDSSNNEFERDNFPSETSLISYCLGLVILNEGTTIIRLVHKSLQDYFDTEYKKGQLFAGGHKDIVLICLTYMNFNYPDSEHLECADIVSYIKFMQRWSQNIC